MHAPTYGRAARLVAAIAQAWPLADPSGAAVEILRAAAPVEVGTPLSAIAPNAIFTDPKDKRWRGAKTMASACAAAAAEAWLCGVGTPVRVARFPNPGTYVCPGKTDLTLFFFNHRTNLRKYGPSLYRLWYHRPR